MQKIILLYIKLLRYFIFNLFLLNFELAYSNLIPILMFHEIDYGPSTYSTTRKLLKNILKNCID